MFRCLAEETTVRQRVSEAEFVMMMALLSTVTALAVDMLLPGFGPMRESFGLEPESTALSLTITVFFVGFGVGNLIYGPLSDAWGRRPVLLGSLALYGLAALAAAAAPTLNWLLLARFVWGVGAGGPRVVSQAVVRDRFSGSAMARVMSMIQAAFFVGPVLAPLLGATLVTIGGWRWIMGFGAVSATVAGLWSLRLVESLAPARRRTLSMRSVIEGFGLVLGNRRTTLVALSITFISGSFYSFLGTTEYVFSRIYGNGGWFVPYFSMMAVVLGIISIGVTRVLKRVDTSRVVVVAAIGFVACALTSALMTVIWGGSPPFPVWLGLFSLNNAFAVVLFPSGISLALEPMGAVAGTAASAIGAVTAAAGAGLSAITDHRLEDSVVPLVTAYSLYGTIALVVLLVALGQPLSASDDSE